MLRRDGKIIAISYSESPLASAGKAVSMITVEMMRVRPGKFQRIVAFMIRPTFFASISSVSRWKSYYHGSTWTRQWSPW